MERTKITMDLAQKTIGATTLPTLWDTSGQPEPGSFFPRSLRQIELERLPTSQ